MQLGRRVPSRKYDAITAENIDGIVEKEIGLVFMRVLEDAGVYKRTEEARRRSIVCKELIIIFC